MWMNLYIIVFDELINYLDNDILVVLIKVFIDFKGGVIMIFYNESFVNVVCDELW